MSGLQRTPLYQLHRSLGARMVPFAGFEMPVQYEGILAEHAAVRERAGLFDVSHMGQIHLAGPGAVASAEWLVSCPVASLRPGRVRYGVLCNEAGGVVDDVTVYRESEDELFFCVNAANIEKDHRWIVRHARPDTEVRNRSAETGLLALQGPASAELLAAVSDLAVPELRRFRSARGRVAGVEALVSRTGYTGSDGFELYLPAAAAAAVFEALLEAGRGAGLAPVGLGARDTLRLEAALPLYGHELDDDGSPLEAGLDRFVKLGKCDFLGAAAIERRRAAGHERALAGFVVRERGIARADQPLFHAGAEIGRTTSGAPSPTLGKSIGLGYVPPALAAPGTALEVGIRARRVAVEIVPTPFLT
ncbi:MAG: glycine cleavage system aminomethyltransferase GcvT [Myxococcota bacterium]|nr:glycine cleavage system aminomethyltransferase GcvT [Myxococcota bacterium]